MPWDVRIFWVSAQLVEPASSAARAGLDFTAAMTCSYDMPLLPFNMESAAAPTALGPDLPGTTLEPESSDHKHAGTFVSPPNGRHESRGGTYVSPVLAR